MTPAWVLSRGIEMAKTENRTDDIRRGAPKSPQRQRQRSAGGQLRDWTRKFHASLPCVSYARTRSWSLSTRFVRRPWRTGDRSGIALGLQAELRAAGRGRGRVKFPRRQQQQQQQRRLLLLLPPSPICQWRRWHRLSAPLSVVCGSAALYLISVQSPSRCCFCILSFMIIE